MMLYLDPRGKAAFRNPVDIFETQFLTIWDWILYYPDLYSVPIKPRSFFWPREYYAKLIYDITQNAKNYRAALAVQTDRNAEVVYDRAPIVRYRSSPHPAVIKEWRETCTVPRLRQFYRLSDEQRAREFDFTSFIARDVPSFGRVTNRRVFDLHTLTEHYPDSMIEVFREYRASPYELIDLYWNNPRLGVRAVHNPRPDFYNPYKIVDQRGWVNVIGFLYNRIFKTGALINNRYDGTREKWFFTMQYYTFYTHNVEWYWSMWFFYIKHFWVTTGRPFMFFLPKHIRQMFVSRHLSDVFNSLIRYGPIGWLHDSVWHYAEEFYDIAADDYHWEDIIDEHWEIFESLWLNYVESTPLNFFIDFFLLIIWELKVTFIRTQVLIVKFKLKLKDILFPFLSLPYPRVGDDLPIGLVAYRGYLKSFFSILFAILFTPISFVFQFFNISRYPYIILAVINFIFRLVSNLFILTSILMISFLPYLYFGDHFPYCDHFAYTIDMMFLVAFTLILIIFGFIPYYVRPMDRKGQVEFDEDDYFMKDMYMSSSELGQPHTAPFSDEVLDPIFGLRKKKVYHAVEARGTPFYFNDVEKNRDYIYFDKEAYISRPQVQHFPYWKIRRTLQPFKIDDEDELFREDDLVYDYNSSMEIFRYKRTMYNPYPYRVPHTDKPQSNYLIWNTYWRTLQEIGQTQPSLAPHLEYDLEEEFFYDPSEPDKDNPQEMGEIWFSWVLFLLNETWQFVLHAFPITMPAGLFTDLRYNDEQYGRLSSIDYKNGEYYDTNYYQNKATSYYYRRRLNRIMG